VENRVRSVLLEPRMWTASCNPKQGIAKHPDKIAVQWWHRFIHGKQGLVFDPPARSHTPATSRRQPGCSFSLQRIKAFPRQIDRQMMEQFHGAHYPSRGPLLGESPAALRGRLKISKKRCRVFHNDFKIRRASQGSRPRSSCAGHVLAPKWPTG
jgi:hypothetical protein